MSERKPQHRVVATRGPFSFNQAFWTEEAARSKLYSFERTGWTAQIYKLEKVEDKVDAYVSTPAEVTE